MKNLLNLRVLFMVVFGLMLTDNLNANTESTEFPRVIINNDGVIVRFVCEECGSENLKLIGYYDESIESVFYVKKILCKSCGKLTILPKISTIILTGSEDVQVENYG